MKSILFRGIALLAAGTIIITGCSSSRQVVPTQTSSSRPEVSAPPSQPAAVPTVVQKKESEIPALRELFANDFPIGAAVSPGALNSKNSLIAKQFNSLTAENVMKFSEIHPGENVYRFEQADKIVQFATENNMKVRGHTFVWHQQTPEWVFKDADRAMLLKRLEDHITTVMNRYKGKVYAWDVVNEAVADGGSKPLRDNKWLEIIGEDYIQKAFEIARKVDPAAILFYNDYNTENKEKRERIYDLIKDLKEKGTPIDAVGLQGHWGLDSPSVQEIENTIKQFASLGVKVQITELDISFYGGNDKEVRYTEPSQVLLDKQAQRYKQIFEMLRIHKDEVTGVTLWGVTDDGSWLNNFPVKNRKNWPLLFDQEGQPKKAFWEVASLRK